MMRFFITAILLTMVSTVHAENHFYLRADVGFSAMDNQSMLYASEGPSNVPNVGFDMDMNFDQVFTGQIGVGYQFVPAFRAEVTLQMYTPRNVHGSCNNANPQCAGQTQEAKLETQLTLLTGFYDFHSLWKDSWNDWWFPYISGGIGLSSNKLDAMRSYQDDTLLTTWSGATRGSIALRGSAGMGFLLTKQLMLDVWYAYTNAGVVETSGTLNVQFQGNRAVDVEEGLFDVRFQEAYLGFRYLF